MERSTLDDQFTPKDVITASGEWLLNLCSRKHNIRGTPSPLEPLETLTPLEQSKFDEFFAVYRRSPVFKRYHVDAVRKCLSKTLKPDYHLARMVVAKDDTRGLFTGESDVLQVAIKAGRLEPGLTGQSAEESCPELLSMVELLIDHGASASCLDSDGNSALFYACVLGYAELFEILIAARADMSTEHQRSLPEQSKESADAAPQRPSQAQPGNVNLLQISLDALISPQRVVNNNWISGPPGVNYDEPLWKLDLAHTWGAIILRLLQEGHAYDKSDPGLVMILHIACHQGSLSFVEKLLDFEIDTNVGGPRLVDGGQGQGCSFGTALHAASANLQLPVAQLLMKRGGSPSTRRQCTFRHWKNRTEDLTPAGMAMAKGHRIHHDVEAILTFLKGLIKHSKGLRKSDYQKMMELCVSGDRLALAERLLQHGITPRGLSAIVNRTDMAQLLVAHNVLKASEMQKSALKRNRLDLLRWCVGEYGPLLPSDPSSWGEMALSVVRSGHKDESEDKLRYLLSEYPGLHIDAVLSAALRLPGQERNTKSQTSWLHMAIAKTNFKAMKLLLNFGADPTFPGLPFDAATTIRQNPNLAIWNIHERVEIIKMVERRQTEDEAWSLPSYAELSLRLTKTVAEQNDAWAKRLQNIAGSPHELPSLQSRDRHPPRSKGTLDNIQNTITTYLPLSSKSSFRLLELLPASSPAAPLCVRLVHSDITFQPSYEALSYVWGDVIPVSYAYGEEEKPIPITQNLHKALTHLRYDSHVRTLWVDALCINQSNHAERNQQVSIMGDIYRSANQVVIWLGEAADDSHLVFAYINDTGPISEPTPPAPSPALRRAWIALITRPWFFRTWVIQEVALSRETTVMCGTDSAPWRYSGYDARRRDISSAEGLSGVSSGPDDEPDHPLSGFDPDSHIRRLQTLRNGSDPVKILRYSRLCQTGESKDRIYGILGLFDPNFITVDYDLPNEQIWLQFIKAVITKTGNLSILRSFGVAPASSLRSWVPDFNYVSTGGILSRGHSISSRQDYTFRTADGNSHILSARHLTTKVLSDTTIQDDGAFLIKGKTVDAIKYLGPELIVDKKYAPRTEAFAKVLQSWESLAVTLIPEWQHSLGCSVTEAFAKTISAQFETPNLEMGFTQWYRHCGTGILEAADPAMFVRDIEFYLWWSSLGQSDNARSSRVGETLDKFARKMELASYGRRFFTTEEGSMGLAGPRARVGDKIVFLPGADLPFVLRRRDDEAGWTMVNDCYLYGLDLCALFRNEQRVVEEFVIL